jgi:hypothetical protein
MAHKPLLTQTAKQEGKHQTDIVRDISLQFQRFYSKTIMNQLLVIHLVLVLFMITISKFVSKVYKYILDA